MLELKSYKYDELINIFKTDRLDKIKQRIKNDGYEISRIEGRGKNIVITISKLPSGKDLFKVFCRDVLKYPANKDYNKLYLFLRKVIMDDDFKNLQYKQMHQVLLSEGINISLETISDYFKRLNSIGMYQYIYGDFIYEAKNTEQTELLSISKEDYNTFYKKYHIILREEGKEAAQNYQKSIYGSLPRKRFKPLKNFIYKDYFDTLISIFENERILNDDEEQI